ncbi:SRPBCC family protein [Sutcliffiella halmapala]|uniref:SRPBCC family protein n=1 Tax=Sutcliffiella halmapala TaxID=79882 RepID=UPI000994C956|nr:SRPBCC domain-containing protein [Sutcliffiella halmapala]
MNGTSSIFLEQSPEIVWGAITNDEHFSIWYAPGSKWSISKLEVGGQAVFTLMPTKYNNLKEDESIEMKFKLIEITYPYVFSYQTENGDMLFIFKLTPQNAGTQVTINMEGFNQSLENLKAYLGGNELPHK